VVPATQDTRNLMIATLMERTMRDLKLRAPHSTRR
jgi:hypothetical protein